MDDFKIVLEAMLLTLLIVAIILGALVGITMLSEKNYCATMERLSPQYNFQWELWGGCLVEVDGLYIHASDYLNKTRQEIELQKDK